MFFKIFVISQRIIHDEKIRRVQETEMFDLTQFGADQNTRWALVEVCTCSEMQHITV